jgi:hypothetical protein
MGRPGGGEGEVSDAVPGCPADELAGMCANLLLDGGRQVRRLGEKLAHLAQVNGRCCRWRLGAAAVAGVAEHGCGGAGILFVVFFDVSK